MQVIGRKIFAVYCPQLLVVGKQQYDANS